MERIDKILALHNYGSRKEVGGLIRSGAVTVNGAPVKKPDLKIDPERDEVRVSGERAVLRRRVVLMMHKPAGILSATEDRRQKTVVDLLPEELQRRGLFPVGRLDKDTTGLLILTDDGAMAHELLSPKKHVDKVYLARVEGKIDASDVDALARGMELSDGLKCLPAGLEPLEDGSRCLVTLREGKYHQVKRMLAARGKPVLELKRLSMGGLALDEALEPGQWRFLEAAETAKLRDRAAHLNFLGEMNKKT